MIQMRPTINAKFRRDAWLEINLAALERNLERIHAAAQRPLIPVLKADAYGHGAAVLVKTLDAFSYIHAYAVASADEALNLREHTNKPIMLLGISPQWAYQALIDADIEITIVDLDEAIKLSETVSSSSRGDSHASLAAGCVAVAIPTGLNKKAKIHLKLDTGMHRIGFNVVDSDQEWRVALDKIEKLDNIIIRSVFSHFAGPNKFNAEQLKCFLKATEGLPYPRHIASSGSITELPESRLDYVRCGIELYGHGDHHCEESVARRSVILSAAKDPHVIAKEITTAATLPRDDVYEPLLSLYARISFIKKISKGDSVSYKGTWTAPYDTYIATLPLGYADGVPRALSNQMQAYVQGTLVPQTGMVTMDQLMLDLGPETKSLSEKRPDARHASPSKRSLLDVNEHCEGEHNNADGTFRIGSKAKVGDLVELIGPHISVNDWATKLNTISYEILTGLNLRLPKVYTRN